MQILVEFVDHGIFVSMIYFAHHEDAHDKEHSRTISSTGCEHPWNGKDEEGR